MRAGAAFLQGRVGPTRAERAFDHRMAYARMRRSDDKIAWAAIAISGLQDSADLSSEIIRCSVAVANLENGQSGRAFEGTMLRFRQNPC